MLGLLGLADTQEGEPMFQLSPSANRHRIFGMYDLAFRFPDGYLQRLDLLTVDRISTDATGWDWEQSVFAPEQDLRVSDIDLGDGRNTTHLGPGWSRGRAEQTDREGDVSFVGAISERAVIFVSLPPGAVELVARVSDPSNGSLEAIRVGVDGRSVGLWHPENRPGYRDYVARLPPDPARPHISTITLRFETSATDDVSAKLARITVRSR